MLLVAQKSYQSISPSLLAQAVNIPCKVIYLLPLLLSYLFGHFSFCRQTQRRPFKVLRRVPPLIELSLRWCIESFQVPRGQARSVSVEDARLACELKANTVRKKTAGTSDIRKSGIGTAWLVSEGLLAYGTR